MKRRPCSKLGSLKLDVCDDLMHELKLSEQLENDRSNTNELKRIEKGQIRKQIVQCVRQQEIHTYLQISLQVL